MNSKIKLSTLLCAIGLIMLAATQVTLADIAVKGGGWYEKDGITYRYTWYQDDKGNKWTEWSINDQLQKDYNGHVRPGPGPEVLNPVPNPNPPSPTGPLPTGPIGVIISPGLGAVLLQSNQPINSQVIDHSTGGIVGTATVNGNGSISTGTLEAGKTYSIISTNNTGQATSNTFMLSNDKQIWISK